MAKTKIVWNDYLATAYAEGFCEGEGASQEDVIEAWAYLIRTGLVNKLQGWFMQAAQTLIQQGIISEEGVISWETLNEIEGNN